MSEITTKSYYAIIPANVRYDNDLTPNAKLLYGEITALCNDKGYCWASNAYFGQLYNVSRVSISKWIGQLAERGYIDIEIEYVEGTKEILHRYLKIVSTPTKKSLIPHQEKFNTPHQEKLMDNNTINNNTINSSSTTGTTGPAKKSDSKLFRVERTDTTKDKKQQKWLKNKERLLQEYDFSENVQDNLMNFFKMLAETEALLADITVNSQLTSLKKINSDEEKIKIIQSTISRGWKSLDYAINDSTKGKKPSFDTARKSQNQFKDPNNDTRRLKYDDQEVF